MLSDLHEEARCTHKVPTDHKPILMPMHFWIGYEDVKDVINIQEKCDVDDSIILAME